MSEIPQGWQKVLLGQFLTFRRGHDLPGDSRRAGSVPVIGSGGPTGWHDRAMASGPGITIGRAANLGRPAFISSEFWPLNTTLYVTDFHGNDVRFSYYLLCALDLAGYDSGSVQPMLNRNYIKDVPLIVPQVREQTMIAALLGALDNKIAVNERIVASSLELARLHFTATMQGESAWQMARVAEVAEVFDGPHATPTKTSVGPWFLSISSLKNGVLDLAESAHLSEDEFAKWTRRVTPMAGDVLFSYETRLGAAALMPSDVRGCLGRRMALMRVLPGMIEPALLLQAFLSDEFQQTIRQRAVHGATVDRIPLKEFSGWPIKLPNDEKRGKLGELLRLLHEKVSHSHQENRALAQLRDALLPKLISGEIRIKDAEGMVEDAV